MVDRRPELDVERGVLCDPDGVLLRRFAEQTGEFLAPGGLTLFLIGSNSAYEALDGVNLDVRVAASKWSATLFGAR